MSRDYWYLFPISVAIATTAMASGIGGAVFFSPLFIIAFRGSSLAGKSDLSFKPCSIPVMSSSACLYYSRVWAFSC